LDHLLHICISARIRQPNVGIQTSQMKPSIRIIIPAIVLVLAMGGVLGAYYLTTASAIKSTTTETVTTTSISTTTTILTHTTILGPFADSWFMVPPDGHSSGISWGTNINDAIPFACPGAATQGCTAQVYNNVTRSNYSITIFYPQVGQTSEPGWANCTFESHTLPSGAPLAGGQGFGYCFPVAPATFIIAQPIVPT